MSRDRFLDLVFFCFVVAALVALLLSVGGCALFKAGRVEARADYSVLARDCSVSLVAVGYCGGEE